MIERAGQITYNGECNAFRLSEIYRGHISVDRRRIDDGAGDRRQSGHRDVSGRSVLHGV